MNPLAKNRFHLVVWALMLFYFFFAPHVFTFVFLQHGKPIQTDVSIPAESDQITFFIEDLLPYVEDGEELYQLIGWSFMLSEGQDSSEAYVPEVVLISDERSYSFPVNTGYRKPKIPGKFADAKIDFNTLGLNVLIADDVIKPGKYRIGVIFRNTLDGSAFYRDKPVYYLVKTPNTLRLEGK